MASPKLQPLTQSPAFKYLRVLEPGAWSEYLRGASFLGFSRGLLVYNWSNAKPSAPAEPVSADKPFRIFVELTRPSVRGFWRELFTIALVIVLVAVVLDDISDVQARLNDLVAAVATSWEWLLGAFGVATLLSWLVKLPSWTADRFLGLCRIVRAVEKSLLALTQRH